MVVRLQVLCIRDASSPPSRVFSFFSCTGSTSDWEKQHGDGVLVRDSMRTIVLGEHHPCIRSVGQLSFGVVRRMAVKAVSSCSGVEGMG